jgi:hypothetical protein
MSDASPLGFAHLGEILGPAFHRYQEGYRFAKLAWDLVNRRGFIAPGAAVYHAMAVTSFWTQPMATSIDFEFWASAPQSRQDNWITLATTSPNPSRFLSCETIRSTPCGARRKEAWTSSGKRGSKTLSPLP